MSPERRNKKRERDNFLFILYLVCGPRCKISESCIRPDDVRRLSHSGDNGIVYSVHDTEHCSTLAHSSD